MKKIFCPYCLTIHDFGEPPICTKLDEHPDVPRAYIQNYHRSSPLWLAAIGFSQHGKTSFINSLTTMLENAQNFWDGTAVDYLDQYTFQTIQSIRKQIRERREQKPTNPYWDSPSDDKPETQLVPRPLLIQINSIPKFDSRCLVVYDTAGEYFETLTGIKDEVSHYGYLKSLRAVKNIWLMISLDDLANPDVNVERKNIRDLLNVYIVGMQSMGWSTKGNNLIVVYTKADRFKGNEYVPEDIRNYLINDPYGPKASQDNNVGKTGFFKPVKKVDFSMSSYLEQMEKISDLLYDYTGDLPSGAAFLNLAKDHGLNVRFTITSSLGTDLYDGIGHTDIVSHRVLDPLLWALTLNSEQNDLEPVTIKLVLDSDLDVGYFSSNYFDLDSLVAELTKLGDEVTTFYLGRSKPCAESGQKLPVASQKQKFPRLIKPLLWEDKNTYTIVITTKEIRDLDDLYSIKTISGASFANKLLIVSLNDEYTPRWEFSLNLRVGDDINLVVSQFSKMMNHHVKGE